MTVSRVRPCTRVAAYTVSSGSGMRCLWLSPKFTRDADPSAGSKDRERQVLKGAKVDVDVISNPRTLRGPASFWWGFAPHHPPRASQAFGRFPARLHGKEFIAWYGVPQDALGRLGFGQHLECLDGQDAPMVAGLQALTDQRPGRLSVGLPCRGPRILAGPTPCFLHGESHERQV